MDLTPPLTRSPSSTPKTYCPSEASTSDFPSPDLFEQHYRISSFDVDQSCSMASAQASDRSSPRLDDALTQPEWSPASVLHPALTTASMPTVWSTEYDVFAPYDGPLSASYHHNDVYTARGQHSPATTLPVTRSPVLSVARVSLQYPPLSAPSPVDPRVRPEDISSEYGPGLSGSQYPSPTLASTPYPVEMEGPANHKLPPLGLPPAASPNSTFASDGALAPWARSDQYPGEPAETYPGADSPSSSLLPTGPEPRNASRGGERPRRAPRKLTTKEEANFQCDVKGCGKFFSRSYNFKAHMETHRERREYPFPCLLGDCNKKFVRKTDLQRHHQSVHMKERNHGCDYCGRMFARRDTLKR